MKNHQKFIFKNFQDCFRDFHFFHFIDHVMKNSSVENLAWSIFLTTFLPKCVYRLFFQFFFQISFYVLMISSNAVTIETFLEEFFQCRNILVDMPEWLPTKKTFTKIPFKNPFTHFQNTF